jgi:hypothetical protein
LLRTCEVPIAPLVHYAVGAVPVSLRAFVPEAALDVGLAVLALGIAWLGIWLSNRSNRIVSWTVHGGTFCGQLRGPANHSMRSRDQPPEPDMVIARRLPG